MLHVHAFSPASSVTLEGTAAVLPPHLERTVEELWEAEQRRRGRRLVNGTVLSAVSVGADRIAGRADEYRRFIAQRARPELFAALQVRPVAVSGLVSCDDGIVFGRRSQALTQDAGKWELAPSGGIDPAGTVGADIDYRAQLVRELREEIGLDASAVTGMRPFCAVDDEQSHVVDIGIALDLPLSAADVIRGHRRTASTEYDELRIVRIAELSRFLAGEAEHVVAVSAALIARWRALRSS